MIKDNNKAEWINKVMDSTTGIGSAQPPAALYDGILAKLNRPASPAIIKPPVKQWAAAAIILLSLNVSAIAFALSHNKRNADGQANPIVAELQTGSTYNY